MVDIPKMIPAKLFLNWPDRIEGDQIYIVRTTIEHLSQYVSWRKWEGKLSLENEEEVFANQKERTRKIKLIKELKKEKELALSIFTKTNELVSLVELYLINTEIYVSRWILKKSANIMELAYETGEILLSHILSQKETEVNSIFVDIPDYRQESISLILNFGFIETSYYYHRNHTQEWTKMLTFRM